MIIIIIIILITIIIIVIKNFNTNNNRLNPHGHHGSKRREVAQHAHSRGLRAFTDTLTSAQFTTTLPEAPTQLLRGIDFFILKVPEGGQANRSIGEKHRLSECNYSLLPPSRKSSSDVI